jgi:hypothetical protein
MISFISYLSYTTQTIRPQSVFLEKTEISTSQSGSVNRHPNISSFEAASGLTREKRGNASYNIRVTASVRDAFTNLPTFGTETFTGSGSNENTQVILFSKNSITYSTTNKDGVASLNSSSSYSEFLPEATVTLQTTSSSTTSEKKTTTTNFTQAALGYITKTTLVGTNQENTWGVKTYETTGVASTTSWVVKNTTITTTSGTIAFVTFQESSLHQITVANTIWETVPINKNSPFTNRLAVIKTENTEHYGINELEYVTENTTILWEPPLSTEVTDTASNYTTTTQGITVLTGIATSSGGGSTTSGDTTTTRFATSTTASQQTTRTVFTQTTTSFLDADFSEFSVEDWITFTTFKTTSNSSTQGTISTTSFSLDTQTFYTFLTRTSVNSFANTTTTQTTRTTFTTHEDRATKTITQDEWSLLTISAPKLERMSEAFGFDISTAILPWQSFQAVKSTIANSLNTETSLNSTVTSTVSLIPNWVYTIIRRTVTSGSSSFGRLSTGEFEAGASTTINKTGSFFLTRSAVSIQEIARGFSDQNKFWVTSFDYPIAASPSLSFETEANKTTGNLMLTLSGNQHTIHFDYTDEHGFEALDENAAFVFPREVVLPISQSFTSVLSKNQYGYGAHPSVWSTITISRNGGILSSTWQSVDASNESQTKFTTESGVCSLVATSNFPHDVKQNPDWVTQTLGGNMQPNSKVVSFEAAGVFYTQSGESASGFVTNETSRAQVVTVANNTAVTVRRKIPFIQGKGFYFFEIPDNGLP